MVSDGQHFPVVRRDHLVAGQAQLQGRSGHSPPPRRRFPRYAPRTTSTHFTGQFSGDGFADFLLGNMASSSIALAPNETGRFRRTMMSFYALDDWKVSPKLTLNIGLRYEYAQIPKELSGLTPPFDPTLAGGQGGLRFPKQNKDAEPFYKNIRPDLGFGYLDRETLFNSGQEQLCSTRSDSPIVRSAATAPSCAADTAGITIRPAVDESDPELGNRTARAVLGRIHLRHRASDPDVGGRQQQSRTAISPPRSSACSPVRRTVARRLHAAVEL